MTIAEALQFGQTQLQDASDAPRLDAERLLLHVLKQTNSSWLIARSNDKLSPAQEQQLKNLLAERATGKPLAYILGTWGFYGREFLVTPDVLIPRPETEELVEKALPIIAEMNNKYNRPITVADIGTGSGCIIVTIALELKKHYNLPPKTYNLIATDISEAALTVAKNNAAKHGVTDQIEFLQGDMLAPLQGRLADLIVSNPPYLPAEALAKAGRAPETRGLLFEPTLALDGGPDGQKYIEKIKQSGVPAVIETTGGKIEILNKKDAATK